MTDVLYYKFLYFTTFASFGILYPYLPVFYESLNISKSGIGVLSMIPNTSSFLFAPIWSYLCDLLSIHSHVMIVSLIVSAIFFQLLSYMKSFEIIFIFNVIGSFFRSPFVPLLDSFIITSLLDKSLYGTFRMWGALGFGVFALIGGFVTHRSSSTLVNSHDKTISRDFQYMFLISTICSVMSVYFTWIVVSRSVDMTKEVEDEESIELASSSLVGSDDTDEVAFIDDDRANTPLDNHPEAHSNSVNDIEVRIGLDSDISASKHILHCDERSSSTQAAEDHINASQHTTSSSSMNLLHEILLLFAKSHSIKLFSAIVLLSGMAAGVIDSFLFLRLKQLGGSSHIMGIARLITCLAEIPMFQITGSLHKKYGTWNMLAVTQLAFVMRFTYYSLLQNPWLIFPSEILHGLTFATTWSVSCAYANEISPPGAQATMQAILEGLHFGLGSGLGALFGGLVWDSFGAVRLFQSCIVMSLLSSVIAGYKAVREYYNNT